MLPKENASYGLRVSEFGHIGCSVLGAGDREKVTSYKLKNDGPIGKGEKSRGAGCELIKDSRYSYVIGYAHKCSLF